MTNIVKVLFIGMLISLLLGCGSRSQPAPVEELRWSPIYNHARTHSVKAGETLYAVAFRYDIDYRQLASLNRLNRPYTLHVGQIINLQVQRKSAWLPPAQKIPPRKVPTWTSINLIKSRNSQWFWPTQGKIAANFFPEQGKKGIDIAGKKGNKIHAAASGVVAYAGSGLQGYGNLIIIKHNNEFLTAYGNNDKNLVKEGQYVKVGQIIAEMGVIDRRYWGLHFEMRKAGNPVNPLNYLK